MLHRARSNGLWILLYKPISERMMVITAWQEVEVASTADQEAVISRFYRAVIVEWEIIRFDTYAVP